MGLDLEGTRVPGPLMLRPWRGGGPGHAERQVAGVPCGGRPGKGGPQGDGATVRVARSGCRHAASARDAPKEAGPPAGAAYRCRSGRDPLIPAITAAALGQAHEGCEEPAGSSPPPPPPPDVLVASVPGGVRAAEGP
ncbi:hypothetical protein [Streptomyces sediminimaris]|uniref:hypothetical protein n=1 Tax=Streptomyces sediminimaris TaxID=3383721 RepID=UPI00399AC013